MIDFFGIGAQKAGTTWIHKRLNELDEFNLPPEKEIHYFDRDLKYPSPSNLSISNPFLRVLHINWTFRTIKTLIKTILKKDLDEFKWYLKYYFSFYSDHWYKSLFAKMNGIKGEITPSYSILELEEIKKMKSISPEAKLIFMLRNPIERAWSHYKHNVNMGLIEDDLTNPNIEKLQLFINSPEQELRSDFVRTIRNFSNVFPRKNILIGFYDAISKDPQSLLEEIVRFLNGDASKVREKCNLQLKENVSPKARMPEQIRRILTAKYEKDILYLIEQFGSHCHNWLNANENIKFEMGPLTTSSTIILNDIDQKLKK